MDFYKTLDNKNTQVLWTSTKVWTMKKQKSYGLLQKFVQCKSPTNLMDFYKSLDN